MEKMFSLLHQTLAKNTLGDAGVSDPNLPGGGALWQYNTDTNLLFCVATWVLFTCHLFISHPICFDLSKRCISCYCHCMCSPAEVSQCSQP